jgi:hypothetical protein
VNHPIRIFRSPLRNLWTNIHEISVSSFDLFGTGFDLMALDGLSYRHARSTKKCFQSEFTLNAIARRIDSQIHSRVFACRSACLRNFIFSQAYLFLTIRSASYESLEFISSRSTLISINIPIYCIWFLLHPLLQKSVLWFRTQAR